MQLCTTCLHVDNRAVGHCPSCGESAFAKVTANGDLVSVPAQAGMPCQGCLQTEHELKLRYYRRVLGMLVMDRIWAEAGYYCTACRRKRFASSMGFTLLLGWWGMVALLFRNPYAIFVNLWALFAPPLGAGELGAMNANEIRASAGRERDRDQRLADVYMRMPGWVETLTEENLKRILANVEYYTVLGVGESASHSEIKTAWRKQAKASHPDRAGSDGHERMVAVNDAWEVLGDERLRHAYDHRDELLAFLQDADVVASEFHHDDEQGFVMVVGCRECRLGFASFHDAADHINHVHPDTDYADILVSLMDDDPDETVVGQPDVAQPPATWRCKACPQTFADYDAAVDHADRAHPERIVVDLRSAVEAV